MGFEEREWKWSLDGNIEDPFEGKREEEEENRTGSRHADMASEEGFDMVDKLPPLKRNLRRP